MTPIRILVVEDNDLMQNMLKNTLSDETYNVTLASDGNGGWEIFQQDQFDIILLDLKLPGIDGLTLLKKITEVTSEPIIIMMTAYGTIESAVEAMKSGAYDYITKPFLAEELIHLIQKALELRRLQRENVLLRQELDQKYSLHNIIGKSKRFQEIYTLLETIAPTDSTVLIQGESGTGKELITEALHHLSMRKDQHLIKVHCAALPVTLLESELFGHEKGAFTDASKRKIGRIELADKGTLFLDDVDDMSPVVQVKLLRVLQEREFERVGGTETINVDVRIIAASKERLHTIVEKGEFREDLYYRLNVVPVYIPPLRERKEDIPLLIKHFIDIYSKKMNKKIKILPNALDKMFAYDWPGNVRELENFIERLIAISTKEQVRVQDLPSDFLVAKKPKQMELKRVVKEAEREHIQNVLQMTGGKKKESAKILGITPKTLWMKIKEYKI